MNNKRIWTWTALVLALTLVLSVGVAFGRYMQRENSQISVQVKPVADLEIGDIQWEKINETYVLKFQMQEPAAHCRVFLAVSEGVSKEMAVYWPQGTGASWQAVPEKITPESELYATFGGGYVYRFYDETGAERTLDLTAGENALSILGLSEAAEQVSLLRLFVEYVPE